MKLNFHYGLGRWNVLDPDDLTLILGLRRDIDEICAPLELSPHLHKVLRDYSPIYPRLA
jgi:hypothetical protein